MEKSKRVYVNGKKVSKLTPQGLAEVSLGFGGHDSRRGSLCLLELVAWYAGERHSAYPPCTCPVLATFGRILNDSRHWPSEVELTAVLRPLVRLLVGTRSELHEIPRAKLLVARARKEVLPSCLNPNVRSDGARWSQKGIELHPSGAAAWAAYAFSSTDLAGLRLGAAALKEACELGRL